MDKITYNTIIATVLFLCIVQNAASQRCCIVVSADTRLPVRDVSIRWDNNEVVKSAWDGRVVVPDKFDKAVFHHPKYETRVLRHEEMTDTVFMLPSARMLSEVIIYGERKRRPDYAGIAAVDRQLIANTPSGGANLLGLLELVAQPFINKIQRNKELKKARRKQILDNY